MFCKNCGKELNSGTNFCTNCGNSFSVAKRKSILSFFTPGRVLLLVVVLVIVSSIVLLYFPFGNQNPSTDTRDETIASSVVNIYCEGASDETSSGGSGTIITSGGLVLTNAHIIPAGKDASVNEKSCLEILPDPTTGASKEIYYAIPVVIPEISEKYDLAFLQIDDVYYDEEEGIAYGEYPKEFPAYDGDLYCKNENVKLGEYVRIYGYPAVSGGYALTITDGVVSSLLIDEGLIITSAKVSPGNSGGLAVDKNGCKIGVPSMYLSDEVENLGVIISNDLILEFINEAVTEHENRPSAFIESSVSAYLTIPGALRSCASTSCEIIRYYAEGAKVIIKEINSAQNWYEVTARDDFGNPISGYMHKSLF